jgi:hypothetical protein
MSSSLNLTITFNEPTITDEPQFVVSGWLMNGGEGVVDASVHGDNLGEALFEVLRRLTVLKEDEISV